MTGWQRHNRWRSVIPRSGRTWKTSPSRPSLNTEEGLPDLIWFSSSLNQWLKTAAFRPFSSSFHPYQSSVPVFWFRTWGAGACLPCGGVLRRRLRRRSGWPWSSSPAPSGWWSVRGGGEKEQMPLRLSAGNQCISREAMASGVRVPGLYTSWVRLPILTSSCQEM